MGRRPKHPRKELEAILRKAEAVGWVVVKGKTHFKMKCPCAALHSKTVSCTPSNPNYGKNLIGQLRRATCWEE